MWNDTWMPWFSNLNDGVVAYKGEVAVGSQKFQTYKNQQRLSLTWGGKKQRGQEKLLEMKGF